MLFRNVIVNYAGTVWVMIMSLAFIPVYIRYLGLEAYGLIGIFAVLVTVLSLLDLGVAPTISREMARFSAGSLTGDGIRNLLRSLEFVMLCVAGIVVLSVVSMSQWLSTSWIQAESLAENEIAVSIGLMGCVIALRFPESLYRASLQGLQQQVQANLLNAGIATLRAGGAWGVLVWIEPTIQIFFLWQIFVSLVSVIAHALTLYSHMPSGGQPARFSTEALHHIAKFASGVMGITFLAILLTQVDKIILSRMLTLSDYAVYALAASVSVAVYNLATPITTAFYPRMAQMLAEGDTNGASIVFHIGAKALSVIGGSAALTIAVLAEPILRVWTGEVTLAEKAAPILSFLMLGSLLNMLMQMPYHAQLALGRTYVLIISNIVAVIVIVPMLIIMATTFGAIGAAAVWPILNLGYLFIAAPVIFRDSMPGEYTRWLKDELLWPLSGTCVLLLLSLWMFPDNASRLVQAALLAAISVGTLLISGLQAGYGPLIRSSVRRIMHHREPHK